MQILYKAIIMNATVIRRDAHTQHHALNEMNIFHVIKCIHVRVIRSYTLIWNKCIQMKRNSNAKRWQFFVSFAFLITYLLRSSNVVNMFMINNECQPSIHPCVIWAHQFHIYSSWKWWNVKRQKSMQCNAIQNKLCSKWMLFWFWFHLF